jgi:hypothetical protein
MQIQRYEVVYGNSESSFIAQINHMIEEGWQPLGGVSVAFAKNGQYEQPVYHQAMVLQVAETVYDGNSKGPNRFR